MNIEISSVESNHPCLDFIKKLNAGAADDADIYTLAFHFLVMRPYWNRVWMYQETALAGKHTFICGDQFIDGDNLEAGMICSSMAVMRKLFKFIQGKIPEAELNLGFDCVNARSVVPAMLWVRAYSRTKPKRALLELISQFANDSSGASDPRDRIFASWGLIDSERLDFKPDYTLSTRDVYIQAAKAVIKTFRNINSRHVSLP